MHFILSINQIACAIHQPQQLVYIIRPLIYNFILTLLGDKADNTSKAINPSEDDFIKDHITEFRLSYVLLNPEQLGDPGQGYFGVVFMDHS